MREAIPVDTGPRLTVRRWFQLLPRAMYEYIKTKGYIMKLWFSKYSAQTGDEHAIETLCDALKVEIYLGVNPVAVRVYAAEALSRIHTKRVTHALIEALDQEPKLIVKEIILDSLVKHKDPETFDIFLKYLSFYKKPQRVNFMAHPLFVPGRRETAAKEGDEIKGSFSTRIMVGWGEGGSRYIRKSAARGLGALGDARAVEPLIKRLNEDPSVYVRRECVYALQKIGDVRAFPYIAELLDDNAVSIRRAAARTLPSLATNSEEALKLLKRRLQVEQNNAVIKDLQKSINRIEKFHENDQK